MASKNVLAKSLQAPRLPPVLVNGEYYLEWKEGLNIWERFTDLDVNKRGLAVYKTLRGLFRDCVNDLTLTDINSANGVKKIIDKLDKVFLKDKDTLIFIAFETFYNIRRMSSENMIDFLVHFEYLYHKMEKQEIVLPQGILAFLLLKAANISTENERLARATCPSMTYENMKACIMKIFVDPLSDNIESSAPRIKSDPMFNIEHDDVQHSDISFQVLSESETEIDYKHDSYDEEYKPDVELDKSDSNNDSSDEVYKPDSKFGKSNLKLKSIKHNQSIIKKKMMSKDNSVQCNTCEKMCKDKDHYEIHLKNSHNEMLCESCPRLFKGNLSLKIHINSVHKTNHTCRVCEKHFENYTDMKRHTKLFHTSEKKESICDICGKVMSSGSLRYHMETTHLSTEVHYCDQCDFHSNTKKNVSKHWRSIHSNLARVKCKFCGKEFRNMDSCSKHIKDFHSSTSANKPFICTICDKAFKHLKHLKRHEMLHSGEKPFGCTLCDYRTNQRSNVTVHMKSHRKQLPEENSHI